ncbi:MAG TPA: 4'-phosphopantetheinyl transferase superfamily protein [Verrucomicrobiae bacterium]|nr:4'-phosphopantetheinyl transferase superfamily protein [Verrucomicrobiae bacterium]
MAELRWPPTPASAELAEGEVHVICVSLNVSPDRLAQLKATLSPDEQDRAAKYRFQEGKDFFVAARGLLREVLGYYLGMPPERIEFRYNQSGKPELAGSAANRDLHFNVAHSGADAVFAVTLHRDIGVDLERIRAIPEMLQMVSYALSDSEKREWDRLEATEWRRAFFDCWARKEAFLKGIGEGLERQPSEIEVPLRRCQPEETLTIGDHGCKVDGWSLRSLSAGDYAVAVAVKGQPTRVSCWAWQPQEELMPAR